MDEIKMTKCPNCGGETRADGANFCPFCGNSFSEKQKEVKIMTKCPNCGGEVRNDGTSFCPFCGNSLLGKKIIARDQSIKETVNEIEDKEIINFAGAEYPDNYGANVASVVVASVLCAAFLFFSLIAVFFAVILSDLSVFGAVIFMFFVPVVVSGIFIFRGIAILPEEHRRKNAFDAGKPDRFIAEVRSYGSVGNNGKLKNTMTIRADIDGAKAFNVYMNKKDRKFYIGEHIRVTVSNGVYMFDKIEEY